MKDFAWRTRNVYVSMHCFFTDNDKIQCIFQNIFMNIMLVFCFSFVLPTSQRGIIHLNVKFIGSFSARGGELFPLKVI